MPVLVHLPPEPLRPFVSSAHGYHVPANPTGLHRGLPSRHLTLVVDLHEPLRVDGLVSPAAAHGLVGGLHTRPALIDASRPQEGLQYGLTPLGSSTLLGLPAGELFDRIIDLGQVFGPGAMLLVERLRETPAWADRFALLDEALLRRLGDRGGALPPEVTEAWRVIFGGGGRVRVDSLAEHVGWSRRHLAGRFRVATGLTPKQAARIARFEAARGLLTSPSPPQLADIAFRCGFADQSHLAREWRALAGCSVGQWMLDEFPFLQDEPARSAAGSPA
ncbi:AraC family transcriptional regulator [Allokutzneria sp. A3M-2-11 16]|uniref:helix-turn-helix transcriptional regulator n=1 Tax=Allokutzneria sp. A3M-2-11 16 TaxID=2962043 RepID=UPI0020B6EBA4|nr:AraC family transcriptional regulator [Allokutzneria sp. A3M-2-11 16]MCP3805290.1 AraC family transcriptional regulator [Allokutzneria sp. A3M-2-11 16]